VALLTRSAPEQASRRREVEHRVLEATEALLGEGVPFADLSVERIATRAGLSRTAFYFYFRDRRELLMRLSTGVADALYAEAQAWWSGEDAGPAELRDALGRVIALYREHGPLLRAVVEASAYDESVAGFWRALVARFVDATRARIEAEQRAGRAPAMPAHDVAFSLCWMTERTCYQRLVQGGELGDADLVRALARVWLGAVYGRVGDA
jgi:AcrR family transcriptional regulator